MATVLAPEARVREAWDECTVAPADADDELRRCRRLFWAWLTLRTLFWSLLAALTLPNAPLDLVEWLSWGHEWRWGYHKHPPLPAWIAEVFVQLSPGGVWGVYVASYVISALCLWAAWQLGREMVSPRLALLSALTLDGILLYFTHDAAEFNNNVVLNACWALAILGFYRALCTDRIAWWLATGLVLGMALLSKYTIAFLMLPMAAFLVWHRPPLATGGEGRWWKRPGPYLAAIVAVAMAAPHLVWMGANEFITIAYGMERSATAAGWWSHVKRPLLFVLSQGGRLLPGMLILVPVIVWPLCRRGRATGSFSPNATADFQRRFLLFMVLGPLAILMALSVGLGFELREIYGSPLWTFLGLLFVVCLQTRETPGAVRRAGWTWAVVAMFVVALGLTKNYLEPRLIGRAARVHFPGRALAEAVSQRWHQRFESPFPLVAGDCWMAGNLGCYAPQRPSVWFSRGLDYLVMDPHIVPWTSAADFRRRGGVVVWDANKLGDDMPACLRELFPDAEVQPALELHYHRMPGGPPVRVGVAFQAAAR